MTNEFFEEDKKKGTAAPNIHEAGSHNNPFYQDTKKPPKRNTRKKIAFFAIIALLFAGVLLLCSNWVLNAFVHTRAEVPVPDITKKSLSNALDLLASSNLAVKKAGEEFAPDIPAGFIVRQVPGAGSIVREGRVIRVWVSEGKETIQMPNLVGMTLRNAQVLIRQSGLNTGTTAIIYSLTYEKGVVTAQSFPEGSPINKGDTINLTVSNGAPVTDILLMPDFRQKKLTDVTQWASQNDISVSTIEDADSLFPGGTIINQEPAIDTEISRGSSITVTVSRRKAEEGDTKIHRIHYEMAQGKNASRLRIVMIDQSGEREILNELRRPGSKVDIEVPYGGETKIRIYVNDILVRERELR